MGGVAIPGTPLFHTMSHSAKGTVVKAATSSTAPPQLLIGVEKTCPLFYPYHFARDAPWCTDLCFNPLKESCLPSGIK